MIDIDAEIYTEFKCKADKCKHSCCKGWEIDIDDDTLDYYMSLNTDLGNEIRQNIREGEDTFFKLTEDERCPFLNDNGLCKIIEELGENGLCDICRLHPRFFVDINDYSMAGVGLSCERAAELIFEKKNLGFIMSESKKKIGFKELLDLLGIEIPQKFLELSKILPDHLKESQMEKILTIFLATEPIDPNWENEVKLLQESLSDFPGNLDDNYLNKFEVIYHYIIFRQLELIEQHGYKKVIDYAICSIIFIMLYANKFHDDHEAVRRWSEQIEYNEDNIELIINKLSSFY